MCPIGFSKREVIEMRRIQVVIPEKLYAFEVKDDFDFTSEEDVAEVFGDYIERSNMKGECEFFEDIKVVCSDCGISLDGDYEKEDGRCASCQAEVDKI
jgi:hypothetical protein